MSNEGYLMKVIDYNNNKNMTIQFQDEFGAIIKNVCYGNFIKGKVKNPYHPNRYGGYLGEKGISRGKLDYKEYRTWIYILERCGNFKSYMDCQICDEWLNFSVFYKWFHENYYEVPDDKMQIDKDLLVKDNGLYGPQTCCFLPCYLNHTIVYKTIDNNLPPGVTFDKKTSKFASFVVHRGKHIFLGYYDNPQSAFVAYKKKKEWIVKEETKKYKEHMPQKIYDALMNWEINIKDKKWNYKTTNL